MLVNIIIFAAALIIFFAWNLINTEKGFTIYSALEEPELPVIYAEVDGRTVNPMHAYRQDMGNSAAADCITPLPADRKLKLQINRYGGYVAAGITYEIRSLDLTHFIERTTIDRFEERDGIVYAELPIQNLIEKGVQYLLTIRLDTGAEDLNFYTRIIWLDDDTSARMLDFTDSFVRKTFDYNEARDLITYLEMNDTADNSSLGHVNIHSSFSQVSWAGTGMKLFNEPEITIREISGIMGEIGIKYMTTTEEEGGHIDYYTNNDEYTLRLGSERVYLMNYDRTTDQIMDGSRQAFSGQRIELGITSPGNVKAEKSENSRYISFKVNKDLWLYDQTKHAAVNVFSFRNGTDYDVRADYDRHDLKILKVSDTGDVDFVVYGYMNRGRHEGRNGLTYYKYTESNGTVAELFFIPLEKSYEMIAEEAEELCVTGANDMFYLKQNGQIVAIDLKSMEMLIAASGLEYGEFASSSTQKKVAWLDSSKAEDSTIKIMDVDTGITESVDTDFETRFTLIDFSDNNLIYGIAGNNDKLVVNNRVKGIPLTALEIMDESMNVIKRYEKPEQYIENVRLEGKRIQFDLYSRNGDDYFYSGADTIVYNAPDEEEGCVRTAESKSRKKISYIALDEEIKSTKSVSIDAPDSISYENAGNIELQPAAAESSMLFCCYINGRLALVSNDFAEAVNRSYDSFGYVTDLNSAVLYNRADRDTMNTVSDPKRKAEALTDALDGFNGSGLFNDTVVLDAQGIELDRVLYYVSKDMPVAALLGDGSYCLIYGFDKNNVKLLYPGSRNTEDSTVVMSKEDAAAYFAARQNDFICAVPYTR